MKKIAYSLILLFSIGFSNCKGDKADCIYSGSMYQGNNFKIKGCLVDNLENGVWSFYDENNMLTASGEFVSGIRYGDWKYPQHNTDSIITWVKFESNKSKIKTNIPKLLTVIDDDSVYFKIGNMDTINSFILGVSVQDLSPAELTIESFYKVSQKEIEANNLKYTSKREKIILKTDSFYHTKYSIYSELDSFKMLEAYKSIGRKKIFHISCRYNSKIESTAKTIFYSILSNCFYNNRRFMSPLEKLLSVTDMN